MIFHFSTKKICYFAIMLTSVLHCNNIFALPFNITVKAGTVLPTTVPFGSPAIAYYTVTNPSLRARNNNTVRYLPPNVSQVTSGGTYSDTCASTINLAAGASCTLQLAITGIVTSNDPDPHHHLMICYPGNKTCAGTRSELKLSLAPFTVVANQAGGSVSICPINADGLFGNCLTSGSFTSPSGVAITKDNAYLYVAESNQIIGCTINYAGGTLDNCTTAASGFTSITQMSLNTAKTTLYASDFSGQTVWSCGSNPTTHALNDCTETQSLNSPMLSVAINSSDTRLYAGDYYGDVYNCSLSAAGATTNCTRVSTLFGTSDVIRGIAINRADNTAYLNGSAGSLYQCNVTASGDINNCISALPGIQFAGGVKLSMRDKSLYVVDNSANEVYHCNANDQGTLTNCIPTGTGFNGPQGIDVSF